ncbi:hypothetical protein MPTK1_2g02330 [Marchantia polymorpha subsp. ruderalis]|nr:hypothetical protein MARPO_0130s0040 [Marchantia polymorpha]BBN00813.1 hypothetical protein Mp_2g02330 [Marchantia polymorpha subsp. ruderalis]|eukprot:PTQ30090.1 hypothetical protein MARPO_0130s0040 [Marchantia polymorpha]
MARLGSGSAIVISLVVLSSIAFWSLPAEATDYNVGGGDGTWQVPAANGPDYQTWASSNTYTTGDRLMFRYDRTQHSVLRVTPQAYDSCNFTSPLETYEHDDAVLDVELEDAQMYYFICGVSGHCQAGQKFNVEVTKAAAAALTYSIPMIIAVISFTSYLMIL